MSHSKYLNREQSKKIFQNGFVKYDYFEMCGFARWAKNCEGWSKDKIEKYIKSEFFKHGLNVVLLRETIHKAVLGSRFDFLEQETVTITKKEIEKISKIKTRQFQKAMFGILVFAKKYGVYSGSSLYIWQDLKEIIYKSGVPMSDDEYNSFRTYIHRDMNYLIHMMRKRKQSWRVQIYSDGEFFCQISDFTNFQKLLPYFCSVCGKETKRKGGYCDEHFLEINKKNAMIRKRRQRQK